MSSTKEKEATRDLKVLGQANAKEKLKPIWSDEECGMKYEIMGFSSLSL